MNSITLRATTTTTRTATATSTTTTTKIKTKEKPQVTTTNKRKEPSITKNTSSIAITIRNNSNSNKNPIKSNLTSNTSTLTQEISSSTTSIPSISSNNNMSSASSSSSSSATPSNSLPKKKARIFSNGSRARAVVFNATNYFNGDSANDDFDFNEPTAPVSNQLHDTPKVRKAHQCHESGESNQVDTDIEYYIESLDTEKNNDTRCLSLLGLAKKVMSIEYRMHLRAHDDMPRIMTNLTDAPDDPSLALSCATLMFIHNQDKMSSDIDPVALRLMLKLINGGKNVNTTEGVEKKYKDKVVELLTEMKDNGQAKNINIQDITAASLATETLLGLNSKRAGDWFKEELRQLKGIDFILDTIAEIAQIEDLETNKDQSLNKLDRCMHLLEEITFQNKSNQEYIIKYNDGVLIDACLELLTLYKMEITVAVDDATLKLFTTALSTTLRVLNNLTSENETSSLIGSRFELTDLILYFINDLQEFIMPESRSDIMMICVCLLINMVEYSKPLRSYLMNETRIHDLIDTFYNRTNEAQRTEQQADQLLKLDSNKREKMTEAMQESVLNQVIAKSGKHMEHSVIAACLAILFGCIIQDSNEFRDQLISYLRQQSLAPLVDVLQKLHDFAHLADIMTDTGVKRVKRILKVLKPTPKHD